MLLYMHLSNFLTTTGNVPCWLKFRCQSLETILDTLHHQIEPNPWTAILAFDLDFAESLNRFAFTSVAACQVI